MSLWLVCLCGTFIPSFLKFTHTPKLSSTWLMCNLDTRWSGGRHQSLCCGFNVPCAVAHTHIYLHYTSTKRELHTAKQRHKDTRDILAFLTLHIKPVSPLPVEAEESQTHNLRQSILTSCLTAWHGNCTVSQWKSPQRIVRTAGKIFGVSRLTINTLYNKLCIRKATSITHDSSDASHGPSLPPIHVQEPVRLLNILMTKYIN